MPARIEGTLGALEPGTVATSAVTLEGDNISIAAPTNTTGVSLTQGPKNFLPIIIVIAAVALIWWYLKKKGQAPA